MKRLWMGRVWLINNINWPVRVLSAQEVVKKALKKGNNDIIHARLGHIGETYSKTIILILDDIDKDPNKSSFYKSYIYSKIMQNLSNKSISKVITKLGKVYIDLWGLSPNISL